MTGLDEALKFPLLTREVGMTPAPGGSPALLPGTAPLNQLVESTLRNVLGWRPRTGDSKGFLAALQQSFTCKDVEGHMECRWTPRGSAVVVQADLGAITGAQASLHTRARHTLEKVLELLDALRPLRSEPDPEDMQGIRSIVRTELIELVDELGTVGGPRIPRVDQIFDLLLGGAEAGDDPESLAGQLAVLQERFGLQRSHVNTVEEEKVYSDFLTLVDYIRSLALSWEARRDFFDRDGTGEAFLGTQLVLLARELAVTSESVGEINFALDSIFLGAAERVTLVLRFGGNEPPVTLAELLDWIDTFVTREAPRLLEDGGKDGVVAFRSTLERLFSLVDLLLDHLPARLDVPRVRRAFEELRDHLDTSRALAQDVSGTEPPTLPDNPISPDTGVLGGFLDIEIQGLDRATIGTPDRLSFGDGITVHDLHDLPPAPPQRPLKAVRVRIFVGAQSGRGERPVVLGRDRVVGFFRVLPVSGARATLGVDSVIRQASPAPRVPNEQTVTVLGTGFLHDPANNQRIGVAIGRGPEDATILPDGITLTPGIGGGHDQLDVRVVFHNPGVLRMRIANPDGQRIVWTGGFDGSGRPIFATPPEAAIDVDEPMPVQPPRPAGRRRRPHKT
jgi:hypothetical protein